MKTTLSAKEIDLLLEARHWDPFSVLGPHVTAARLRLHPRGGEPGAHAQAPLHRREIDRLRGAMERDGYTLVPLAMNWVNGKAKVTLGLAKGKNVRDKRDSVKDREWQRQKGRVLRRGE